MDVSFDLLGARMHVVEDIQLTAYSKTTQSLDFYLPLFISSLMFGFFSENNGNFEERMIE